jgi:ubiquinone biosynthesis protein
MGSRMRLRQQRSCLVPDPTRLPGLSRALLQYVDPARWILVLLRIFSVAATVLCVLGPYLVRSATVHLRGERLESSYHGQQLARLFEILGGGCLKLGQILSTRTDLLPRDFALPLQRLQDSLAPFSAERARSLVEHALHVSTTELFSEFDPLPIGSATVAQVHRAVLRDSSTTVAVKIRRPGVDRLIRTDSLIVMALVRMVSILPPLRAIPLVEATKQIMRAVEAQTDFELEAEHHRQIFALFESGTPVRVPRLLDQYCTNDLLVMEYFPHVVRITAPELDEKVHRSAVTAGLQALYRMLFVAGVVHCDLHPGNILVNRDGTVLLLDFGFATIMPSAERSAFAEFFLCIAFNNGSAATKIVLDTALRVPPDLNRAAFQQEIGELLGAFSGRIANDFLIAAFVTSLFNIQRRHRVYGSPGFTMAILSLMVYEGIIRDRCADLDFQKEAIPTLLASLNSGPTKPQAWSPGIAVWPR